jgi:signal transduction histidine kinase
MEDAWTPDIEAEQAGLRRVATLVARGVPGDELFRAVTAEVGRLFGPDLAAMGQYVQEGSLRVLAVWMPDGEQPEINRTWPLEGDSISAAVLRTGRPARRDHWDDATGPIAALVREFDIRSSAGSPIVVDGRVWGILLINSMTSPFPSGTERRMAEFAELIATAIANLEARAAAGRLADEQAALRRVATLVARETSAADVFAAVAEEVGGLLGVSRAAVFRYEDGGSVTVMAEWGEDEPLLPTGTRFPLDGDNLVVRIRRSATPVRMDEYAHARGAIGTHVQALGVRSGVGAPIMVGGRLWGGIVAVWRRPEPLPADAEARMAQFTELVATAIANMEARAELAGSRARLVAAADDERRRVVRDLHDGAQQRLVHVVVTLNMARNAVEGNERARALLAAASAQAERTTAELRELAHGILPSVLTHGGLSAGVDALASRMPVPVAIELPVERLPAPVAATAYFVVAEALANAAEHAQAERAVVTARIDGDTLHVEVQDDGVGGARADGPGLLGLADRLAAVGGQLDIASPAHGGTRVVAAVPIATGEVSGRAESSP